MQRQESTAEFADLLSKADYTKELARYHILYYCHMSDTQRSLSLFCPFVYFGGRLSGGQDRSAFSCCTKLITTTSPSENCRQTEADVMVPFDGAGWVSLSYPDNGHWKAACDPRSGSVKIQSAQDALGVSIVLSMAPMSSQVPGKQACGTVTLSVLDPQTSGGLQSVL